MSITFGSVSSTREGRTASEPQAIDRAGGPAREPRARPREVDCNEAGEPREDRTFLGA